ncbi:MAG: hypothetical protein UY63_C0005G0041 [Parcubacteria group bacterium GW2011_GWA2_51_10]|nr:MAG: hypothetical protein UY63_C0005G0041 [Parcubacteria group bacterium GW2011_GWA2_51_10]
MGGRRDPLRLLGRRLFLLLLLVLVVLVGTSVWSVYWKERGSKMLRTEAEAQLSDLTARRAKLEKDLATLKTDRGMEEILREQYQLARSGERLIIIVDPPKPKPNEQEPSAIMEWFGKIFSWW